MIQDESSVAEVAEGPRVVFNWPVGTLRPLGSLLWPHVDRQFMIGRLVSVGKF